MEHHKKKGGLAIAWFATCAWGLVISLTGIGAIIGIPAIVVGLVLAIVALVKKQKYKGLSIAAIAIGVLSIAWLWIFAGKVKQFANPMIQSAQEIQAMVDSDPELKALMEDEAFEKAFQANLKKRIDARTFDLEASLKSEWSDVDLNALSTEMWKMISEETRAAIDETRQQLQK